MPPFALAATDRSNMQDVQMVIMLHDFVSLQGILKSRQTLSTFIERICMGLGWG